MTSVRKRLALLRGLWNGRVAFDGPHWVTFYITRRCNLKCPWCRYHSDNFPKLSDSARSSPLDFPLDLFSRTCEELKAAGVNTVVINGEGEPTMHPNFLGFLVEARNLGLQTIVFSNGTTLDETLARELVESGLTRLRVSLWCASTDGYARNYPGADPSNFDRITAGLKRLRQIKLEKKSRFPLVSIHHPITRANFQEVQTMVSVAQDCRIDYLSFGPFKHYGQEDHSLRMSSEEETRAREVLQRMRSQLDAKAISHNISDTLQRYEMADRVLDYVPCYIGWLHACIRMDGRVRACNQCDETLGDLNRQTFGAIWNDRPFQEFRRQMMTDGSAAAAQYCCDCDYCCHLTHNTRVHRIARWFPWFSFRRAHAPKD